MHSPDSLDLDAEVQALLGGLDPDRSVRRPKRSLPIEPDIDEEVEQLLREHTQQDPSPQQPRQPDPPGLPPACASLASKCSVIFELAEEEEEEPEQRCPEAADSRSWSRPSRPGPKRGESQELLQRAAERIGQAEARLLLREDKFVRFDRLASCEQAALDRGFSRTQDIVLQLLDFEPLGDLLLLSLTDGAKLLPCSLAKAALLLEAGREPPAPDRDFAFAYRLLEAGSRFCFGSGQPLERGLLLHLRGMALVCTGASVSGCLLPSNIIAVLP